MDKKTIGLVFAGLVIIIAGLFLFTKTREPAVVDQVNQTRQSKQVAEEWIKNNSPTYTFDGADLNLVSEKELADGEKYQFTFSFVSSAAGYGDRSDQMAAQVITRHTIEVVVEDMQVVSAVTDGVYDEMAGEMIDEASPKDEPASETLTVEVYFVQVIDGEETMVPVEREIPYTAATARAAIEELLQGPLSEEKEKGYMTEINEGTGLQSIEIDDGVAKVDFNQRLDEDVAGSAKVTAIRNQIELTLLQFDTVDEVVISVDGRTENILQP
jgi:spore germination protein GerM